LFVKNDLCDDLFGQCPKFDGGPKPDKMSVALAIVTAKLDAAIANISVSWADPPGRLSCKSSFPRKI
jgi:hypothetical protein